MQLRMQRLMVGAIKSDTPTIPCADGYATMNDRCVACGGGAGATVIRNFAVKLAMIFLMCAKLLEKLPDDSGPRAGESSRYFDGWTRTRNTRLASANSRTRAPFDTLSPRTGGGLHTATVAGTNNVVFYSIVMYNGIHHVASSASSSTPPATSFTFITRV